MLTKLEIKNSFRDSIPKDHMNSPSINKRSGNVGKQNL